MRIPLFIDPSKWTVVVFGGGKVGTRRALKFKDAGAKVRVVANEFTEELRNTEGIELVKKDIKSKDEIGELIEDADLVVIATSSKALNDMIYEVANEMGKLINDATNAKRSDVHVPFETEVEGIRIAVTSEGASGVSAHLALAIIEKCLKNNQFWININNFATRFKEMLKENVDDPKRRFGLYWYVMLQKPVVELIRRGNIDEALKLAMDIVKNEEKGITDISKAMSIFLSEWGDELLASTSSLHED